MRLDQFLQKTGIIKRRALAKALCDKGAVELDDKKAKPGHQVAAGSSLRIRFRQRICNYTVVKIPAGNVKKEARKEFVKLQSDELLQEDIR